MTYTTLRSTDGEKFDISAIDQTIRDEFENEQDLRSYFVGKYGMNIADAIIHIVDKCGVCHREYQTCVCNQ